MARNKITPPWFTENVPEEIINSEIFRFNISISEGQAVSVDMISDLAIDYGNIQKQLEEMPSIYAYWAAMYSELKEQTAILERKIRTRKGALTKAAVAKFTKEGARLTDKQLSSVIDNDSVLTSLEEQYEKMQKNTGKMYHMVTAISMKADMIRTLAGFAKIEMGH